MFVEKANIVCWCIEIFTLDGFIATVTGFCFFLFSQQVEPINLLCWNFHCFISSFEPFVKSTPRWLGSKVHFLCKSNFFIFIYFYLQASRDWVLLKRINIFGSVYTERNSRQERTGTRRWNHHRRQRRPPPDAREMCYWWGGRASIPVWVLK